MRGSYTEHSILKIYPSYLRQDVIVDFFQRASHFHSLSKKKKKKVKLWRKKNKNDTKVECKYIWLKQFFVKTVYILEGI